MKYAILCVGMISVLFSACKKETVEETQTSNDGFPTTTAAVEATFEGRIDLGNLPNYSNQAIPNYINEDNSGANPVTNAGATLGRVLFYDKNLSATNTISCGSCHKQALAFGDDQLASTGANGVTARHAMRLVNARFGEEVRFFWDERANSLEEQTTMPIQDHAEMGFSGQNGDPDLNDLIEKLEGIEYYTELFTFAFGSPDITEQRMQLAMAQFVRSIQSFDSKYDAGRSLVNNNGQDFPNFTAQENLGKRIFNAPPGGGGGGGQPVNGAGCQRCHRAPEFDIAPNSRNNGIISVLNSNGQDLNVTRSPTLRDMVNANGQLNAPLMHDGSKRTLEAVIDHYNAIPNNNNNLDNRLTQNGQPQRLQLSQNEKDALVAFLRTLSGNNIYTDEKWSDPFR